MEYKADPRRIQYRKGLQMPAKCIYAARPSPWGNPYAVATYRRFGALNLFARFALERLTDWDRNSGWLDPLINADYAACWCKLNEPCHVDLLFAFADLIVVQSQLFVSSLAQGFTPENLQRPAKTCRELHWAEMTIAIMTHDQCIAHLPEQPDQSSFDLLQAQPESSFYKTLATLDGNRIDLQTSIVLATNLRRCADSLIATAESVMNKGE